MQSWHTPYLGLHELPRDISSFELQTFFTYRGAERELIEARRGNALKLGLALHIGFLRLSGRLLNAPFLSFKTVPNSITSSIYRPGRQPNIEYLTLRNNVRYQIHRWGTPDSVAPKRPFEATFLRFESEQENQSNQRSTHPNSAPVLGLRTASYCTENEATPFQAR